MACLFRPWGRYCCARIRQSRLSPPSAHGRTLQRTHRRFSPCCHSAFAQSPQSLSLAVEHLRSLRPPALFSRRLPRPFVLRTAASLSSPLYRLRTHPPLCPLPAGSQRRRPQQRILPFAELEVPGVGGRRSAFDQSD